MEINEIIKAAPEIGKATAAVAASIPFTGLIKRMLGPAADEVAEMLRDQVRLYRYGRQMRCIEKAEKMAIGAGYTPKAVPPKILFPLLEGASMEEDENLHDMWAALLANASSDWDTRVRPSFIRLLRDMAPDEGRLLKDIFDQEIWLEKIRKDFTEMKYASLSDLRAAETDRDTREYSLSNVVKRKFAALEREDQKQTEMRFFACVQSLESVRLIIEVSSKRGTKWELSNLGVLFMQACSPPQPIAAVGDSPG